MTNRFARIISILFSPLILISVLFFLLFTRLQLSQINLLQISILVFGIGMIPPISVLVFLKKKKLISDWGMSIRKERYQVGLVALVSILVSAISISGLGITQVEQFMWTLLLGGFMFVGITFFWKISAHTAAATLFGWYIHRWFGESFVWVWLVVILVFWARIVGKHHTILQSFGGIVLIFISLWIAQLIRLI